MMIKSVVMRKNVGKHFEVKELRREESLSRVTMGDVHKLGKECK